MTEHLHLAIALDGYGWHPEAWRYSADLQPVTSGRYWSNLATTAERGLLDFVTFDDALTAQRRRRPEIEPRWLAGRPDAVLVASRVAPVTSHIGLIPVATVTHTEPFHISKAIATLDFVSHGRAGWQVRVSGTAHEAELFGRRDVIGADLFDEASDAVEVVRRLWDSWEDDAIIRDVATGRFVDRDKLHYIDFAGKYFSVKGPVDHPAFAAGSAGRRGPRARIADLRVRFAQCRSGLHHPAGRRLATDSRFCRRWQASRSTPTST